MEEEVELVPLVDDGASPASSLRSGSLPRARTLTPKKENKHYLCSSSSWKYLAMFIAITLVILLVTDSIELETHFEAEDLDRKDPVNETMVPSPSPQSAADTQHKQIQHQNDEPSSVSQTIIPNEYVYQRRARKINAEETAKIEEHWGSWSLAPPRRRTTTTATTRNNAAYQTTNSLSTHEEDYYANYPNRDVPRNEFPSTAWQLDVEYVERFLKESKALVSRVMEAILTEYGHGTHHSNDSFVDRSTMFRIDHVSNETLHDLNFKGQGSSDKGGWTTPRSWRGLKRRLLHAVMTEDTFNFAMGGHSAAAGHGNHFQQSYTLQVQRILEPVFARLGVKHESRNFGNGGLGTLHNGIAAGSIYGPDVSFLVWDSGMTEKDGRSQDIFARQALLGGNKVPVLWSLPTKVLRRLHQSAGVDVGSHSSSSSGIPKANVSSDFDSIAWAALYLKCGDEVRADFCKPFKYNGTCWINRKDYSPTKKQAEAPEGRAGWHPGNRSHQLVGRTLAFTILSALYEALDMWSRAEGQILLDEEWHVTDYFNNIRTKVANLDPSIGNCYEIRNDFSLPDAVCKYPLKARTEFTPRGYPSLSSIRSVMPSEMKALIPGVPKNEYKPPDVFNPFLNPPPGEIDVLAIAELGTDFQPIRDPTWTAIKDFYKPADRSSGQFSSALPPGKGVDLVTMGADHLCDGTYDSFCHRNWKNGCLLSGHNDERGHLRFDSYSGWILLDLPRVHYGVVIVKMQTWHPSNSNSVTEWWTSVNNEDGEVTSNSGGGQNDSTVQVVEEAKGMLNQKDDEGSTRRSLNKGIPEYCDQFQFQYALNGTIITLNREEFQKRLFKVQRVVEVITLLDDPGYTNGQVVDVPVAIRILGCGRQKVFSLTHVYWA